MEFKNHPCFNDQARHSTGRIHLPVARKCNIQCNFCNRKYDCVNESRPGVTSNILSPEQALSYMGLVLEKAENISVIGIAGPGDPFANPDETMKTLELIRGRYPNKILCVATNGLGLQDCAGRLAGLNISHVTVTVNAVDPEIGAKIYPWVRVEPKVYRKTDGARLLLERQTGGIKMLKSMGISVKINTVIIPGINDEHAADVAEYAAKLGADVQNCIPMMHVEDTAFEGMPSPDSKAMTRLREAAGKYLPQMSHCARCRADAAGLLGGQNSEEIQQLLKESAMIKTTQERPYVAVASMEGLFVNRHLGEAPNVWIYGLEDGRVALKEQRPTPEPGSGDARWEQLAAILKDCIAVQVSNCGPAPKRILEENGLTVMAVEGLITETAAPLLEGREVPKIFTARAGQCGAGVSCGGTGMGCG